MAKIDIQYKTLINDILDTGIEYEDPNRKGTYRKQIPVFNLTHDMREFPAVTTKKLAWKSVVGELIWFLRGDTNIKYLVDNGINIWNKDAYNFHKNDGRIVTLPENEFIPYIKKLPITPSKIGDLGRIYGAQWRNYVGADVNDNAEPFNSIDQISNLIKNLRASPFRTDHIVTAWNPAELDEMALPPCHFGFQVMCYPLGKGLIGFDLIWDQRSVDTFLGLPFNIASYALLMEIIGQLTSYIPGTLHGSLRNVHLYNNSYYGAEIQAVRDPNAFKAPSIEFGPNFMELVEHFDHGIITLDNVFQKMEIEDFTLVNYNSYGKIPVEMLSRD